MDVHSACTYGLDRGSLVTSGQEEIRTAAHLRDANNQARKAYIGYRRNGADVS
jgi:hypothetical protein